MSGLQTEDKDFELQRLERDKIDVEKDNTEIKLTCTADFRNSSTTIRHKEYFAKALNIKKRF